MFRKLKEQKRKGDINSEVGALRRCFGYIERVAETDDKRVPLVFVRLEGRQEGPLGDSFIPLEYCFREYETLFGDTDITGSYVQVLIDANNRIATAKILALAEELEIAKEDGGKGTGLRQIATGINLKKIEEEGVPATKPYLE